MSISCEFQLERFNAVYYSGEEIKGSIILRTQKNIQVNAVFVILEGEATCEWSGRDNGTYHDKQQLLQYRNRVFDGPNIVAGNHIYDISMPIPYECPSTCEGPFGHISYVITVKLERPLMLNKLFRKSIIVNQLLDLNDYPEYKLPVKDYSIKYLGLWLCRSGPILSNIAIPFSGYIPEQSISLTVNIDNQSQYDIAGIEASLNQHMTHFARKSIKNQTSTKMLSEAVITKTTLRLSKRIYETSIIVPPNTLRTTLRDNCIVSLHYELQVKLITGQFHKDIVMKVPIVIGTLPLERLYGDHTLVTMQPTSSAGQNRNQHSGIQISNVSYANSSILQTIDHSQYAINEQQRIFVNLPQFPVYDTLAGRTQPEHFSSNSEWD